MKNIFKFKKWYYLLFLIISTKLISQPGHIFLPNYNVSFFNLESTSRTTSISNDKKWFYDENKTDSLEIKTKKKTVAKKEKHREKDSLNSFHLRIRYWGKTKAVNNFGGIYKTKRRDNVYTAYDTIYTSFFYPTQNPVEAKNKKQATLLLEAMHYKQKCDMLDKELTDSINVLLKGNEILNKKFRKPDDTKLQTDIEDMKSKYEEQKNYFNTRAIYKYSDFKFQKGFLGLPMRVFPTIAKYDASYKTKYLFENRFDKFKILTQANFTFPTGLAKNNAMTYLEAYKDYLGYFRFSVGTIVQQIGKVKKDSLGIVVIDSTETQSDAISRIMGGGGNLVGNATLPIIYFMSKNNLFRALFAYQDVVSIDVPAIGTVNSDINFANHFGLEGNIQMNCLDGNISFFASAKYNYVVGTDKFFEYLGYDNTVNNFLNLNSLMLGIGLGNMFKISYSVYGGASFVKTHFPNSIQLSFIPTSKIFN